MMTNGPLHSIRWPFLRTITHVADQQDPVRNAMIITSSSVWLKQEEHSVQFGLGTLAETQEFSSEYSQGEFLPA